MTRSPWFKWMSGPPCKRCRKGPTEANESWCGGCLALASSLEVLRGNWWSKSHRRLAEEVLVQASRQVRALHSLDKGLQSLSDSFESRLKKAAGSAKPPEPPHPPSRRATPVLREALRREASPKKEPVAQVEGGGEASGVRGRSPSSEADFGSRSETPLSSPRAVKDTPRKEEERSKAPVEEPPACEGHDQRERSRSPRYRQQRKRPHHRGGAKHQRHYRHHYNQGYGYHQYPEADPPVSRGRGVRDILDSDI